MAESRITGRMFILALIGALSLLVMCLLIRYGKVLRSSSTYQLTDANEKFFRGDYKTALREYVSLAQRPNSDNDLSFAIACCHLRMGESDEAAHAVQDIHPHAPEDLRFIAWVEANSGNFDRASETCALVPEADTSADTELLEAMALAAAKNGNRPEAWRFYRRIQKHDPASAAIDHLNDTGLFNFAWFGYGPRSPFHYSKGIGSGVLGWAEGVVKSVWHLVWHPIDSVTSVATGIAEICSPKNLRLLLSPKELTTAVGGKVARLYWSGWEACKLSAVREFDLNLDRFEDQQEIHEIAAGRMFGYVAPDIVIIVLSAGGGAALEASQVENIEEATELVKTEQRLEEVNEIGRSAEFLSDTQELPHLRKISWLTDELWQTLKASPKIVSRKKEFVECMNACHDIPGAEKLVQTIAGRLDLSDVEGYIFQLQRAAKYAKEDKLAEIGSRFKIEVALPDKPVKSMIGDADVVLKDGTLIETKWRANGLALDESLHKQLIKYDRAVKEGKFTKVRIECNGTVSQKVKDRCDQIRSQGTSIEIIENLSAGS